MNEQLISFETAKLAKEKNFNEETFDTYHNIVGSLHNIEYKDTWNTKGSTSAPTQSLLQKWLRDVYNIQLCLKPLYGGDKIEGKQTGWLCYTPYNDEEFTNVSSISLSDYTYEKALEKGLYKALQLIK